MIPQLELVVTGMKGGRQDSRQGQGYLSQQKN